MWHSYFNNNKTPYNVVFAIVGFLAGTQTTAYYTVFQYRYAFKCAHTLMLIEQNSTKTLKERKSLKRQTVPNSLEAGQSHQLADHKNEVKNMQQEKTTSNINRILKDISYCSLFYVHVILFTWAFWVINSLQSH